MDKSNRNSDTKKNQSDNKEIQEFFKSKAYLDKPILTNVKKQSNIVKKNKKGIRSKLKERPIESDLFNFHNQKNEKGEKEFHSATDNNFNSNIGGAHCFMNTSQEIGAILRAKRKSKNLTQKQLASLAYHDEMQQSLISRIEAGNYKSGFEDVAIILNGLGVDLIELIVNAN